MRVVNLALRQEGVWAGRIAPRTLKLATYRGDWPAGRPTALPAALCQRKLLGARLWETEWARGAVRTLQKGQITGPPGNLAPIGRSHSTHHVCCTDSVVRALEGAETVDVLLW